MQEQNDSAAAVVSVEETILLLARNSRRQKRNDMQSCLLKNMEQKAVVSVEEYGTEPSRKGVASFEYGAEPSRVYRGVSNCRCMSAIFVNKVIEDVKEIRKCVHGFRWLVCLVFSQVLEISV